MDGRKFILHLVDKHVVFDEVIMNLPHNAIEFLDVFIGLHSRRVGAAIGERELVQEKEKGQGQGYNNSDEMYVLKESSMVLFLS